MIVAYLHEKCMNFIFNTIDIEEKKTNRKIQIFLSSISNSIKSNNQANIYNMKEKY